MKKRSLQFGHLYPNGLVIVAHYDYNGGWSHYEVMFPEEYEVAAEQPHHGMTSPDYITAENIDQLWDAELLAHKEPRYEEPIDYVEATVGELLTPWIDYKVYHEANFGCKS
jgi:hypothetical protein